MSRICGVVSTDYSLNIDKCFSELCDVSWGDVEGERQTWCDGSVGLGHLKLNLKDSLSQPVGCSEDGYLVSCGKLVDTLSLSRELRLNTSSSRQGTDDSIILSEILSGGRNELLSRLNGLFTAANWQQKKKKLILVNDRLGFRPLYYSYDVVAKRFVFSSDLRGVVKSLARLSEVSGVASRSA